MVGPRSRAVDNIWPLVQLVRGRHAARRSSSRQHSTYAVRVGAPQCVGNSARPAGDRDTWDDQFPLGIADLRRLDIFPLNFSHGGVPPPGASRNPVITLATAATDVPTT